MRLSLNFDEIDQNSPKVLLILFFIQLKNILNINSEKYQLNREKLLFVIALNI